MAGVIEKRRELLDLMRECTLKNGFFTVHDIECVTKLPRSTVQDWVNRLADEKCVLVKEEKRGRNPAKYMARSVMLQSSCKRIFTTVDKDRVAIYHECRSAGCAAFCTYHHSLAKGAVFGGHREGMFLIEYAALKGGISSGGKGGDDANANESPDAVKIGSFPLSAVGISDVRREGDMIVQQIRCFGGPAYSLTEMMKTAEGVCDIRIRGAKSRDGAGVTADGKKASGRDIITGEILTRAMKHLIIGIDDTDSEEGGATFALALGLLQYLGKMNGVIPISHRVVMLNPALECTAGNSCSFIELAVLPEVADEVKELAARFVEDESLSDNWGIAVKEGFVISEPLRGFGFSVRERVIAESEIPDIAAKENLFIRGGKGVVGAVAAVSFCGLATRILLCPAATSP
ncbi:sugar-specific transcriptional regulator TrmB [Methanomicrobium mobile]|uniref:sugar-specific transcriptional regulator TrmB n=1 Tax=Methanomicrobium mobile TaxID=2205 RepID=UPI0005B289BF|nr:sugar-specific transcriptional regulator TrmB [Methanomicrobium mobile]